MTESKIDKRKVVMRSISLLPNGDTATAECVDYVPPDILEAYVADARTRWQYVEVSEKPDAGPAGYDGDTHRPRHLEGHGPEDFARYGGPDTPDNALDEILKEES